MVKLKELLNNFSPLDPSGEQEREGYKYYNIVVNNKRFEIRYKVHYISLEWCLTFASNKQANLIRNNFDTPRMALDFQFFYVDDSGNKTQEVQSFSDGTIFQVINYVGSMIKNQIETNKVNTLLFGGDRETRERVYDLFAKRVSREPPGWTVTKSYGRGPTGEPGVFWAIFKNGT